MGWTGIGAGTDGLAASTCDATRASSPAAARTPPVAATSDCRRDRLSPCPGCGDEDTTRPAAARTPLLVVASTTHGPSSPAVHEAPNTPGWPDGQRRSGAGASSPHLRVAPASARSAGCIRRHRTSTATGPPTAARASAATVSSWPPTAVSTTSPCQKRAKAAPPSARKRQASMAPDTTVCPSPTGVITITGAPSIAPNTASSGPAAARRSVSVACSVATRSATALSRSVHSPGSRRAADPVGRWSGTSTRVPPRTRT